MLQSFQECQNVIPKLLSISPHPPPTKILETKCFKIMQHIVTSNVKSKVYYISLQAKLITTTTNAPFCYVSLAKLMGLQLLASKGG